MPVTMPVEGKTDTMAPNWSVTEALVHDLAHELRQPLSEIEAIAYYLEMASTPGAVQSKEREMLRRIRSLVEAASQVLSRAEREVSGQAAANRAG